MGNLLSFRRFWKAILFERFRAIRFKHIFVVLLNPFKGLNYFNDFFNTMERIHWSRENGNGGCEQVRCYQMLVANALCFALYHTCLVYMTIGGVHPNEWTRLVLCDYVGMLQLPPVFPATFVLTVPLYLVMMRFLYFEAIKISSFPTVKSLVVARQTKFRFLFNDQQSLIRMRRDGFRVLSALQFFLIITGNLCWCVTIYW